MSQPAGDLLGDRRRRPDRVQPGVLVPGARQPVGGERRRQASRRSRTRSSAARRSRSGPDRRSAARWSTTSPAASPRSAAAPPNAASSSSWLAVARTGRVGEALEEVGGEIGGLVEQGAAVGHRESSLAGVPPSYAAIAMDATRVRRDIERPRRGSRRGRVGASWNAWLRVDAEPREERLVVGLVEAVDAAVPAAVVVAERRHGDDRGSSSCCRTSVRPSHRSRFRRSRRCSR